jgi:hypothetical protein
MVPSCVYSGADIKLVIHLPNAETSVALAEIEDLQGRIDQIVMLKENSNLTSAQLNQVNEELQRSNERIQELMTEIAESQSYTKDLAEISTLSVSTHREKFPVRTLGSTYPRSYTRGGRTIGGSMVFTVFHKHIFQELIERSSYRSTGAGDWDRHRWSSMITDQLPPLDISIRFANEYGNLSWMALLGVEFVNEGLVMSVEDLYVEGTNNYVARGIDLLRNVASRSVSRNRGVGDYTSGTRLLNSDFMRRTERQRNPFL